MTADRTVHAETATWEVVRYDRAGKWWVEKKDGSERQSLTFRQAVEQGKAVIYEGGTIHRGRPGGRAFDRAVPSTEGAAE